MVECGCCGIHAVPPPPVDPTDVVFVLEASKVIGSANFERMKVFLSKLVGKLDIAATRVGIVTYSSQVGSFFNLGDHSSVAPLQSAIMSLTYSGGSTNTAEALKHVRTMLSAAGARANVPKVVATLIAGPSDEFQATKVLFNRSCIISTVYVLVLLTRE